MDKKAHDWLKDRIEREEIELNESKSYLEQKKQQLQDHITYRTELVNTDTKPFRSEELSIEWLQKITRDLENADSEIELIKNKISYYEELVLNGENRVANLKSELPPETPPTKAVK